MENVKLGYQSTHIKMNLIKKTKAATPKISCSEK